MMSGKQSKEWWVCSLMPMAFCSDYDGTLRRGGVRPDARNLEAVRRFRERGGLFGINTGRTKNRLLLPLKDVLELDFAIIMSGALVLDGKGRVLWERRMPRAVMKAIIKRCQARMLGLYLVASEEYWTASPVNLLRRSRGGFNFVRSLDDIPDPVYGVAFRALTPRLAGSLAALINGEFGDVASAYQNGGSVDIVPAGCSKATGLEVVRRELGVDVVAAMGDSYNDIPMLGTADVGYTFPDAPKEVRTAARAIMPSVAAALEDFANVSKKGILPS